MTAAPFHTDLKRRYDRLPGITRKSCPFLLWVNYPEHVREAIEAGTYHTPTP